jgi:hypothetical protein
LFDFLLQICVKVLVVGKKFQRKLRITIPNRKKLDRLCSPAEANFPRSAEGTRVRLHCRGTSRGRLSRRAVGTKSMFVWLVADGWCWFVLREKYCWLIADGWFVLREKYCWLVTDKPSEQGARPRQRSGCCDHRRRTLPATAAVNSHRRSCALRGLAFADGSRGSARHICSCAGGQAARGPLPPEPPWLAALGPRTPSQKPRRGSARHHHTADWRDGNGSALRPAGTQHLIGLRHVPTAAD